MDNSSIELKRLKWLCRRGTRELDVMLEDYLVEFYPNASEIELKRFTRWLEQSDPVLWEQLMDTDGARPGERVRACLEL